MKRKIWALWVLSLVLIPETLHPGDPYWGYQTWGGDAPRHSYVDSLYMGRLRSEGSIDFIQYGVDSFYGDVTMPGEYAQSSFELSDLRLLPVKLDSVFIVTNLGEPQESLTPLDTTNLYDKLTWEALLTGLEWWQWPPRDTSVWKQQLNDQKDHFDALNRIYESLGARITAVNVWNEPFDGGTRKHMIKNFFKLFVWNPNAGPDSTFPEEHFVTYAKREGNDSLQVELNSIHDPCSSLTVGYLRRHIQQWDTSGAYYEFGDTIKVLTNEDMMVQVRDTLWTPVWFVPNMLKPVYDFFRRDQPEDEQYDILPGAFTYSPWIWEDSLPPGGDTTQTPEVTEWHEQAKLRWFNTPSFSISDTPPGVPYWMKELFDKTYYNPDLYQRIRFHIYMNPSPQNTFDPYDTLYEALDAFRQVVANYHSLSSIEAWITEWGAPGAANDPFGLFYQARNIGHFLKVFDDYKHDAVMPISHIFGYALTTSEWEGDHYGLLCLYEDGQAPPKPAYYVVKNFADGLRNPATLTWDSLSTYPYVGGNLCAIGDSAVVVYPKNDSTFT